jgi:protein SCO1/2
MRKLSPQAARSPPRRRRLKAWPTNTAALVLAASAASCAAHHTTTGVVVATTPATVTISHDPFPGYMDAMTMPFERTGTAQRVALTPGDRVRFRLAVGKRRSVVDRIDVVSAAPVDAGLERTPAAPALVHVGGVVPDFTLVDQSAAPVSLASLRGKVVAVTFIYTRCPLPDYCPRMIENFRAVRTRFAPAMDRDLVLLTVSFDPQYDTPERLAAYAAANRAVAPGWHFLTGDAAQIQRVCEAFGIQYYAEEGLITHSLQTAVIGRDGRLAATVEGKAYTPRQLGDVIESALGLSGR